MRKQLQPRRERERERQKEARRPQPPCLQAQDTFIAEKASEREKERKRARAQQASRCLLCRMRLFVLSSVRRRSRKALVGFVLVARKAKQGRLREDRREQVSVKHAPMARGYALPEEEEEKSASVDRHMAYCSVINGKKLLSDSLAVYGSEKITRRTLME